MTAQITEVQQSLGLNLKPEWLAAFTSSLPATSSADQKRDRLLAAFLTADLNQIGAGCLPAELQVNLQLACCQYYSSAGQANMLAVYSASCG